MNTEAHGTLVRLTVAIRGGSNPARAPLKVIRVWEFAAAMKQPNELVNPTSPMNQSNQRLKCRDRSRKGAASLKLPRKLTPVTASANVRPTRPRNPPGEPPLAWNGALRWFPCTRLRTTIDKMISPSASLQNMMNEARAEMTTPRSSSGTARATPTRVTASHPALPQLNSAATHEPMNTTTAATVTG